MTQFLPPNLLALFAARDPIPYLPPVERLSHEKRTTGYTGIGDLLGYFETGTPPPRPKYETKEERSDRRRREKQEQVTYKLEQEIAMWDPAANEKATTDGFRTIFIGRINYDTTESKLRREFESFGPIKKIYLVKDKKSSKPRGYAFVEYEHERDMQSAYKHGDGRKVDAKRVLVDIERGRTVKGWLPRRLGGGLGGTRRGGPEENVKISGREDGDRDRFRDDRREERTDRRDRRGRDRSKERAGSTERDRSRHERRRSSERVERVPRDRDRERGRDKDRKRRRSRSRDRNAGPEENEEDKPRRRSRSREKKRHKDRSRSKDKKRDKKDRDRDRADRKDRERKVKSERVKDEDSNGNGIGPGVKIKEEPVDDYPSFGNFDYANENSYMKPEV